jgi:hypothetical protein
MGLVGGVLLIAAFLPKWTVYGRNVDLMALDYPAVRQAWEWSALSVALAVLGGCAVVIAIVGSGHRMRMMLCIVGSLILVALLAAFFWANSIQSALHVVPRTGGWMAIGAGVGAAGWSWIAFSASRSRGESRWNGPPPASADRLDLWGT